MSPAVPRAARPLANRHISVRRRCPPNNSCNHNQTLIKMQVIYHSVVPHAPAPARGLSLQALHIALERIPFHRDERGSNARLISWRKFSELFLGGTGELKAPVHGGIAARIQHPHDGRQRGLGEERRVRPWPAGRPDTAARNRRAGPRGPTPSASGIPLSVSARLAAPSPAAGKWSSFAWSSWIFSECYQVTLVPILCPHLARVKSSVPRVRRASWRAGGSGARA
jgi:hypothetical protein